MSHARICDSEAWFYWRLGLRLLGLCVLAAVVLIDTGCVSRGTYERVRAETDKMSRSLITVREEVEVLHRSIPSLEAANREEERAAEELRAAVQREVELLPILRQQAYERMASLQSQVVHLADQSRMLTKQIAAAKREADSLKVLVAQYKREMEEARMLPEASLSPVAPETPALTESLEDASSSIESVPSPVTIPQHVARTDTITPVKQTPLPGPPQAPAQTGHESWIDVIMNWLSSVWNWILGLFG